MASRVESIAEAGIQVIKAAEKAHLWSELVFLYVKYDEFVSFLLIDHRLFGLTLNLRTTLLFP